MTLLRLARLWAIQEQNPATTRHAVHPLSTLLSMAFLCTVPFYWNSRSIRSFWLRGDIIQKTLRLQLVIKFFFLPKGFVHRSEMDGGISVHAVLI